jgi:signal transduction histidine kinase
MTRSVLRPLVLAVLAVVAACGAARLLALAAFGALEGAAPAGAALGVGASAIAGVACAVWVDRQVRALVAKPSSAAPFPRLARLLGTALLVGQACASVISLAVFDGVAGAELVGLGATLAGRAVLPPICARVLTRSLAGVDPSTLEQRARSSWVGDFVRDTWLGTLGFAMICVGAGVAQAGAVDVRAIAMVALALGAALVAAYVASRSGRRTEQELRVLVGSVSALEPRSIEPLASPPSTPELRDVARALERLAERFQTEGSDEDRARQSVEELQRAKMRFMASMSHDLRGPLNAILGFSELLHAGEDDLAPAQRDSVRTVVKSGEEMLHLLNDVLDAARFEAGRLSFYKEWTPSVEILTEAVKEGRQHCVSRGLDLEAELQPGLPPVYVDRERIVQAVVCLLRHAARAMDHGAIKLTARVAQGEKGRAVRIAVTDRSEGIRAADRERIFQAFREISGPSGRRIGGLGLALSLARSLVIAQGGAIDCQTREGEGTTFTVLVPATGPAPAGARAAPRTRTLSGIGPEKR